MKAIVLTANQKMELQKISLDRLEMQSCRIKVKNVGVCSSDIERSCGNGAYFYPLVMGHELAGEVVEIGSQVKNLFVGDAVVVFPLLPCFRCEACKRESYAQCYDYSYYGSRCNGGYAEYLDVKEWNLLKIPQGVDYADAATVEPLAVVIHALKKSQIDENKNFAIIGAGFLGLLMTQIIKLKFPKCQVTVFDRNDFKLEIAGKYACKTVLLKDQKAFDKYLNNDESEKFNIVLEASGVPANFANAIAMTAHNGVTLWMGNVTGDLTLSKKMVSSVLRKELKIIGTWNSEYNPKSYDDWKEALDLIRRGLRPSHLVTHWISLEEVPQILLKLYNHKKGLECFNSIKSMVRSW